MDEKQPHSGNEPAQRSLKEAIRAARIHEADRTGVVIALRDAELARLELLRDKVKPVFDQVPEGVDLFDTGLTPGDPARLWVDMIAFVEMGRDKRTYRFLQDSRHGRTVIVESESADRVADAVTAYVAQRLIERERALAARPVSLPPASVPPALALATLGASGPAEPAPEPERTAEEAPSAVAAPAEPPRRRGARLSAVGVFVMLLIGAALGAAGVIGFAEIAARF